MAKQARPSDPGQSKCEPSEQRPACWKTESHQPQLEQGINVVSKLVFIMFYNTVTATIFPDLSASLLRHLHPFFTDSIIPISSAGDP